MSTALQAEIEIQCAGDRVILRGDGTAFLPSFNALLMADLHLGKSASFRAGGIPVPRGIDQATLAALGTAIDATNAANVLLLGDLIHHRDSITAELIMQFADWREERRGVAMTLIRGNHDRHVKTFPESWKLTVSGATTLGSFYLVHEVPLSSNVKPSTGSTPERNVFRIGGHWHPVISIGRGADRTRLPCFVVGECHVILPAFGPFKGGMKQSRTPALAFYPICEGKIWQA